MSKAVLDILMESFPGDVLETASFRGDETAVVKPPAIAAICRFLKEDPRTAFNLFVDLCGADYPGRAPRFEVVYHLYSTRHKHRIRLKVRVPEDAPAAPSITRVYLGANWPEREAYDMYGIKFDGHPDMRRILMYDGFDGHPLRKDYPIDRRQSRLPPRLPPRRRD